MTSDAITPCHEASDECLFFHLDADDTITEIGGRTLADIEQSRPDLRRDVVGTNFFDHVAGHFTKKFLREFLETVRRRNMSAKRLYRCDSPVQKRLMELTAAPAPGFGLRLEHRTVELAALPNAIDFRPATAAGQARFLRCSHCNRLSPPRSGEWREPEQWVMTDTPFSVVHTVCRACRAGVRLAPITRAPGPPRNTPMPGDG